MDTKALILEALDSQSLDRAALSQAITILTGQNADNAIEDLCREGKIQIDGDKIHLYRPVELAPYQRVTNAQAVQVTKEALAHGVKLPGGSTLRLGHQKSFEGEVRESEWVVVDDEWGLDVYTDETFRELYHPSDDNLQSLIIGILAKEPIFRRELQRTLKSRTGKDQSAEIDKLLKNGTLIRFQGRIDIPRPVMPLLYRRGDQVFRAVRVTGKALAHGVQLPGVWHENNTLITIERGTLRRGDWIVYLPGTGLRVCTQAEFDREYSLVPMLKLNE